MTTVGAYEAKTHLSELLDRVAKGEKIAITKHGVTVAILTPPPNGTKADARAAIARLRELRKGRTLGGITIRELIEEGRRY
jgi:prevent-host-death family protein